MKRLRNHIAVLSFCFMAIALFPITSAAGIRGLPEGKSKVVIGEPAPLEADDLKQAHKEGKIILLMFGNPDHCTYCEKVWTNINALLPQYENNVAGIIKRHRASKFWGPPSEDAALGERYGVIGEPWLFVIDKQGIVRNIIMGPVGKDQIEAELKKLVEVGNK